MDKTNNSHLVKVSHVTAMSLNHSAAWRRLVGVKRGFESKRSAGWKQWEKISDYSYFRLWCRSQRAVL